ncbi:MAG: tRNA (adenosine(37)-N6)-dimethylallyltransferase MiaA [Oscillospiraceae bacterium]
MAEYKTKSPIVVICGPTASGKTKVAIELAKRINGEIVCADSMQIYDTLKIGTARPTEEEMQGIAHHLYGFLNPNRQYSVSEYVVDANKIIGQIADRGAVPIVCGGTGLYIRSLVSGMRFTSENTDFSLRMQIQREYEEFGAEKLLAEIAASDSECALTLHPNNMKRIVRTLELLRTTGKCVAELHAESKTNISEYPCAMIVLSSKNREYLYDRIERRVDLMMKENLLNEARWVYDNRIECKTAAQAIGYKEFFGYFEGRDALQYCVDELKKSTRHYAKRQITWFKRDEEAVWADIQTDSVPAIADAAQNMWNSIQKKQK